MKKTLPFLKWISLTILTGFLGTGLLKAQQVDDFGMFDPPLTGTQIVYAKTIFHDGDNTGVFDAAFSLSEIEIVQYADYSAVVTFYTNGMHVRPDGSFQFTNAIVPVSGEEHEIWILVNVVEETYRAWAKKEDMDGPVLIYEGDANFRRTGVSAINYWTAFHNPEAQNDYVEVLEVDVMYTNVAQLDILSFDRGEMTPAFSPDILDYDLVLPFGSTSVTISANGIGNIVEVWDGVEGVLLPSNGVIPIPEHGTDLEIIVTSMLDGTESSYMVYIDQGEGRSVARLNDVELSLAMHSLHIQEDVYDYEVVVPSGTTSFTMTGIPLNPAATVSGDGEVTMSNGTGSATLVVTSPDETETETYTFTFVEPSVNYAIQMAGGDGNNSHIDISGLDLNASSYTIEMWIMPEGTQPNNAGLFYMRDDDGNHGGVAYASGWQPAGTIRFMTNIPDDYGVLTSAVPTNTWHHLAVVLTPDSRTIYLNGTEYRDEREQPLMDYSSGRLFIGWDEDGTARTFRGLIDEIRVWDKALTPEELEENSFKVLSGDEEGLKGYWNFEIPHPAIAWDSSPTGQHGSMVGGTYVPSFIRANLNLASLTVDGGRLYPEFAPATTEYYVLIEEGATALDVDAQASDSQASVTGTGSVDVTEGVGVFVITVTSEDGEYSRDYTIKYLTDITEPVLMHSYTFADGTAKDQASGADGRIMGGEIVEGKYIASEQGHYIELPAEDISLKNYNAITLEAYVTNGENPSFTMLAYFGGLNGANSYWVQPTRNLAEGDNTSRTEIIGGGTSVTAEGIRASEFASQHFVSVVTYDSICWYIDGMLAGVTQTPPNLIIPVISTENAWIGRSGWAGDANWMGEIFEFNIYKGAMQPAEIAVRSTDFPIEDNTTLATLASIEVNDVDLENFVPYQLNYIIDLGDEVGEVPVVTATLSNPNAGMVINPAESLPGTTTIVVTAEDGVTQNVYSIEFLADDPGTFIPEEKTSGIMVYPTVSSGQFQVKSDSPFTSVSVFSVAGQLVSRVDKVTTELAVTVPAPGMYVIIVETSSDIEVFKVIKTN